MIIALVLISAFLHAAWNALLKREADKDRALIAAVSVGAILALIVALAQAAVTSTAPFQSPAALGWALVAGGFEQLYFLGLARALERGPLGPVYTISRGGAVIVVYPLSVLMFGEHVSTPSLAGSALVLLGLVLSGLPGAGPADARRMVGGAAAYAVACAFAIAAYHLAYKAALEAGARRPRCSRRRSGSRPRSTTRASALPGAPRSPCSRASTRRASCGWASCAAERSSS